MAGNFNEFSRHLMEQRRIWVSDYLPRLFLCYFKLSSTNFTTLWQFFLYFFTFWWTPSRFPSRLKCQIRYELNIYIIQFHYSKILSGSIFLSVLSWYTGLRSFDQSRSFPDEEFHSIQKSSFCNFACFSITKQSGSKYVIKYLYFRLFGGPIPTVVVVPNSSTDKSSNASENEANDMELVQVQYLRSLEKLWFILDRCGCQPGVEYRQNGSWKAFH